MKLDTGEEVSIVSEKMRKEIFPEEKLRPLDLKLKTYTNQPMKVAGTLKVTEPSVVIELLLVMVCLCLDGKCVSMVDGL